MAHSNTTKIQGASSLLGAAFCIGTFGIWVRVISPMLGNAAQTTARFALAALLVGGFYTVKRKSVRLGRRDFTFAVLIGLASFGTGFLFTVAANSTKIANSLSVMYAGGIVSALVIGTLFLKEKLGLLKIAAAGVALLGLSLYAQGFAALNVGVLAALGAGLCDSIAHAFRKQVRGADRNVIVMCQYIFGGIVAALATLLSGGELVRHVSAGAIIGLLAYAAVSVGLGKFLLYGFSHFDVNVGAVILATQLFFATLLGMVFLHEFPAARELAGAGLIFFASIVTVVDMRVLAARLKPLL